MITKQQIEEEFEKNQKQIFLLQQQFQSLLNRQEQLKGQFQLLDKIEKEEIDSKKQVASKKT